MSDCPPDSWLCPNEECAVYNKPTYKNCRFCKTDNPLNPNSKHKEKSTKDTSKTTKK